MPTVLRWKGYRFFFYSADEHEPPHVHIRKESCEAKIWLEDLSVAVNIGFSQRELRMLVREAGVRRDELTRAWHGHFEA
ncbi:MAG: DUF4160 domain-containing protein [Rhizobiales bacterium]|nr:DUF4160 domain-containing protein [Hyphomicrobiales bacterium]